jgi:hypothetical protein
MAALKVVFIWLHTFLTLWHASLRAWAADISPAHLQPPSIYKEPVWAGTEPKTSKFWPEDLAHNTTAKNKALSGRSSS